jgi:subtilisin family serine protease
VSDEDLPAYALPLTAAAEHPARVDWPCPLTRAWAWGDARGAGVRVCVVDSGIDGSHPRVGVVQESVTVRDGRIVPDDQGDASGHGTACAGLIRALAPVCALASVRVLGADIAGTGADLIAGLRWAVEQRFEVINLSLSTTREAFVPALCELADQAYFRRCLIVSAAHNLPVASWPWRFASVLSVAGHTGDDPYAFHVAAQPPVEFLARGVDVEVAWSGGSVIRMSGNSLAAPHLAGLCALIRSKHPALTPAQVRSVLQLTASNAALEAVS